MENYQIKRPASNKTRKRVGRGPGSGMGKTSTRGQKGQMSRSGSKSKPWFEGGQMPIQRRVPKRGFKNATRVEYQVVNVANLSKLNAGEITPDVMKKSGLVKKSDMRIKVLGTGEISQSCTVTADAFSKSAVEKIQKAGGKTIVRKKIEKTKAEAV
ncbi:MAG TPA: 50S ribosomal protein L15 [Spirochaetota bacterium]|nr:50S ribosomal protein L15 [Spirochaetota bacterium]